MSLCHAIVEHFKHQGAVSRFDDDDRELYSNEDLVDARDYALGLIEDGYVTEPMDGFNLRDFATFCNERLIADN